MMTQTQIIPLPIKGVNRNMPRGVQPDGTCWDALNVLPFDRQGRTRLALRGGAGKVETLDAAAKVRLLHVASTVNTAGGGPAFSYVDAFTYADGTLDGNGNWEFPTDWFFNGDPFTVSGDTIRASTNTIDGSWARQTAALIGWRQTSAYTLSAEFQITTGSVDKLKEVFFGVHDNNSGGSYLISADIIETAAGTVTVGVNGSTSGHTQTGVTLARNNVHTVSLVCDPNADTIVVKLNGSTLYTVTTAGVVATADQVLLIQGSFASTPSANAGTVIYYTVSLTGGTTATLNRSILKLVACSGDTTYVGFSPSSMSAATDSATYPIDATAVNVSAATLFGKTYIVDGTNLRQLDLTTDTMQTYTASAGSAPTGCSIAVSYRGRLVISGTTDDPQNMFASKVGDPTNWDYSAIGPDRAWAGNASKAGRVGAPIHALMPLSDDIMLVGCESSTWAVRGDPADGGSIDNISNSAGVLSQNAWDIAADGSLYFVGSDGLYKANPDGSSPIEVSRDSYRQFFQSLNRSTQHVNLIYDRTRYGLWIFVTPEDQTNAPVVSLFYDLRLEGFWPIEFTNMAAIGPLTAVYWDGFDGDERYPVLGGYDGRLSVMSFVNRRDNDGVANQLIPGYIVLGPIGVSATDESILSRLDVTGGEVKTGDNPNVWHLAWKINAGQSAYAVTEGTPLHVAAGTFTFDRRQVSRTQRVRGQWFSIRLGNENNDGDYFTIEQVAIGLTPAGKTRRPG